MTLNLLRRKFPRMLVRYFAYSQMIDSAARYSALWRLVAGLLTALIVLALWVGGFCGLVALQQDIGMRIAMARVFAGGDSPEGTIALLLFVGGLGYGAYFAARIWHRRDARSLFGPGARTLRHFAVTLVVSSGVLGLLAALPPYPLEGEIERNLQFGPWLRWLPWALLALLVQTGAEELFFRGYLQSQIAARVRHPVFWLVLPSLAFGFAHYVPGLPGENTWIYVAFATCFGLIAADLTARTGSIGAAWGFHFANNSMGVLFVASSGSLSGVSLWINTAGLDMPILFSPGLILELAILLGIWLLVRRALEV